MGLIARTIEETGIPTIYLGSCRCMMAQVKPPRAAFVNFPLGRQCGRPNDIAMQKGILRDSLNILVTATSPGGIVDLPYEWGEPFDWLDYRENLKDMLETEGEPVQEWKPEK